VENLVRESFWNVYRPGCLEHFVLHRLRDDPAFVKELDFVMEKDGEIIGYCGMWVLFEEAHITNIAIHPKLRGQGYGKQLLHASMRAAASFGAEMMTLEVRETNTVAQSMYAEMDFLQQGRRKRYYSDTGEDALLLWNRNMLDTIEKNACLNQMYLLQFDSFLKGE
jgi:ribosomal-protein-alanine acetyltransferase